MRETDLQVELGALRLRAKAHADQRQLLLETLGDPGDHVGHQGAHRARIIASASARRRRWRRLILPSSLLTETMRVGGAGQRAQGAPDDDLLSRDRHVHAPSGR